MDGLGLLAGLLAIAVFMDLLADRRHNAIVALLKEIKEELASSNLQTDLRHAERRQAILTQLRKEFPEISEKIDDRFARSCYIMTREVGKLSGRLVKNIADNIHNREAKERVGVAYAEAVKRINYATTLLASEELGEYLRSIPREELDDRLRRVREAAA